MEPIRTPGLEKYLNVISGYDNEFAKWQSRTKKILKRYRDDTRGQSGNETAKFNILWSNVQTLIPAVYAKLPKAHYLAFRPNGVDTCSRAYLT